MNAKRFIPQDHLELCENIPSQRDSIQSNNERRLTEVAR